MLRHIARRLGAWTVVGLAAGSLTAAIPVQERADQFLGLVNAGYQALYRVENEALWKAATDVKPVHDASSETAGRARAAFNGNPPSSARPAISLPTAPNSPTSRSASSNAASSTPPRGR